MASRTQLRLGQLTGSFGDVEGGIIDTLGANSGGGSLSTIELASGSMVSVISELASAIKRINGGDTFANQAAGVFNQDLQIAGTTPSLTIGDNGLEDVSLVFDNASQDYYMGVDHSDSQKLLIGLGSTVGTGAALTVDSSANLLIAGSTTVSDNILASADSSHDIGASGTAFKDAYIDQVHATGLTGSLTDTTLLQNQIAYANAQNTLVGNANFTFDGSAVALGGSVNLTVGGNATVSGDLTVQGTTVTLDTTNLNVQDPFILLGDGAQAANSNSGIIFVSGSSQGSSRPDVAFARKSNDTWGLGSIVSNSGSITDATSMTHDVALMLEQIQIEDANNFLAKASTHLRLSSDNNVQLNSGDGDKIELYENNSLRGQFQAEEPGGGEPNMLVLSSSDGYQLSLSSNSKKFTFLDGAFDFNGNSFVIDLAEPNEVRFTGADNTNPLLTLASDYAHEISGSLRIEGGEDPGALRLSANGLQSDLNVHYVEINAPVSGSGASGLTEKYQITLPTSAGTSGQVLAIDSTSTDGGQTVLQLGYTSVGADSITKAVKIIGSLGLDAGSNLDFSSTDEGAALSGLNASGVEHKNLDVFVNGQLLVSGTSAQVDTDKTRDYSVTGDATIKFAFALEEDDVVQAIKQ